MSAHLVAASERAVPVSVSMSASMSEKMIEYTGKLAPFSMAPSVPNRMKNHSGRFRLR